jgi:hypothetical protein
MDKRRRHGICRRKSLQAVRSRGLERALAWVVVESAPCTGAMNCYSSAPCWGLSFLRADRLRPRHERYCACLAVPPTFFFRGRSTLLVQGWVVPRSASLLAHSPAERALRTPTLSRGGAWVAGEPFFCPRAGRIVAARSLAWVTSIDVPVGCRCHRALENRGEAARRAGGDLLPRTSREGSPV